MKRRMWAVSQGSYSDYRVLCVCPTKADAEAVVKKVNGDEDSYEDARIEQIHVATAGVERVHTLHLAVEIANDGSELKTSRPWRVEHIDVDWPWGYRAGSDKVSWRWVRAPMYNGRGGRLEVSGTDHELVRRVFSERRAWLMTDQAARDAKALGSDS